MLITSSWLIDIILLFLTSMFIIYKYSSRKYDYWRKKGIYYINPLPFFGNALDLCKFKKAWAWWARDIYNAVDKPFFGIFVFNDPYLILKSPELIKQVLVKDFSFFMDRTSLAPEHDELFKNLMFVQKSQYWKKVRPLMTPVFTSGKLKAMFPIMNDVALEMNTYIRKNLGYQEAKELCAKYTTDVIAKCAFAIHANSFNREDAEFRKVGRMLFDFSWRNAIIQSMFVFLQDWASILRLNFFDPKATKYLSDVFWKVLKQREETNLKRNDLIDTIIEIRKKKELCDDIKFEGRMLIAQVITFFVAGFETTSATIAFTLYELCLQPTVQNKLREEILNNIKEHSGITYDGLIEMKYLDMCISETLRKYSVVPFLDRRCTADYKIPGTDITIEKGTPILIPTWGLHLDEKYFPDPETFNPERFYDKAAHNVNGLYYLPFGEGPRICIGERFGLLVAKLGLIHILSEFVVERTSKTPVPLEISPRSIVTQSEVGVPIKFTEIPKIK